MCFCNTKRARKSGTFWYVGVIIGLLLAIPNQVSSDSGCGRDKYEKECSECYNTLEYLHMEVIIWSINGLFYWQNNEINKQNKKVNVCFSLIEIIWVLWGFCLFVFCITKVQIDIGGFALFWFLNKYFSYLTSVSPDLKITLNWNKGLYFLKAIERIYSKNEKVYTLILF